MFKKVKRLRETIRELEIENANLSWDNFHLEADLIDADKALDYYVDKLNRAEDLLLFYMLN